MIEHRRFRFALCGSRARKVKRGHANLLGGRASRRELLGLTAFEIGADFDLVRLLNHGTLPAIYLSTHPKDKLRAYCADYLKENSDPALLEVRGRALGGKAGLTGLSFGAWRCLLTSIVKPSGCSLRSLFERR